MNQSRQDNMVDVAGSSLMTQLPLPIVFYCQWHQCISESHSCEWMTNAQWTALDVNVIRRRHPNANPFMVIQPLHAQEYIIIILIIIIIIIILIIAILILIIIIVTSSFRSMKVTQHT